MWGQSLLYSTFTTAALAGVAMSMAAEAAQPVVGKVEPSPQEWEFPVCSDDVGTAVGYITAQEFWEKAEGRKFFVYRAGAFYLKSNPAMHPVIVYNPDFVGKLNNKERAFVFSHECGHLSSGDSRTTYLALDGGSHGDLDLDVIEKNADCGAARRVRDEFHFSHDDMMGLRGLIERATVNTENDEPRFQAILECYAAP